MLPSPEYHSNEVVRNHRHMGWFFSLGNYPSHRQGIVMVDVDRRIALCHPT